jgi:hypothetical protein
VGPLLSQQNIRAESGSRERSMLDDINSLIWLTDIHLVNLIFSAGGHSF